MANVRDSDTSLWLHNKLGTSNDSWTSGSICSQLSKEVLRNIKDCFPDLQTQVKLKLLLSFFHIPRRLIEEWKCELEEIIDTAGIDSELWVSMLAENMKTLPATGSLNTEITDYEETRPIFMDMVNDLRKLVTKHSDLGMLPLECQYLNKAALTSMVGQQPAPQKHFTLKRKPKSTALRAELLQKSCDAQSTLKKVSAPTIPLRSRGMPRKMTDTTPLKGIPSRVPTSGFRSPPSLQTQNRPNFSRIPAGRKEGGVKLLDITEQPLGYAAAKKRKRQQELEEQQKKMETQATNNNNNPSSTNNNASSPTSTPAATTPTSVASTTPDYAAGLTATSVYTQPPTPAPSTASKLIERPLSPTPFTLNPTTSITSTTVTTPAVTSVIKTEPNALLSPSLLDDELQPSLISIIKTEPTMLQESAVYIKSEPMASIVGSTPMTSSIITTTTSPFTSLPSNVIIQQQPQSSVPSIVSSMAASTAIQSPTINKIVINTNKPQISNSISSSTLSSNQISSLMSATTTIPSSTIVKTIPSSLQQIQTSLSGIQTILTSPPTHQQTTNNIIHIPRQTTIKQIPKPQTTKVVTSMQPQQHQLHQQQISQPTKIVQIKTQPTIVVSSSNSISHQNIPPLISTQVPSSNKINITNIQNVNIPLNKIQMDASTATKTNIIRLAGPRPMGTATTGTTASALIQQQIQQQQQQKMGQIVVQSPGGIKGKTIILANPNQLASKGVIIRSVGPVGNTVYQQIPFSNFINSGPPGLIKTEPGTGGSTTQSVQQNQNNNNQQLPALVPTSQYQAMPSLTPVMITSSNLQQQQQQQMPALLTTSSGGGDQTQKTAIVRPVQMANMQGMNVLPQGLTLIQRPGQQPQLVQVSNQAALQRTIIAQQPQHGDGQQQTVNRPQTIFVPQGQIQQQQMQQQNITNQNPQTNRKGLSLKHKHYAEAQAIFQNANVVTRVEKAVILGFMSGYRENPKPSPENTIVIKLDDTKQKILQENGSYVITSEKSFIKLDYNTGEWKTFKETTILEQHHEEQNPMDNSVAIN